MTARFVSAAASFDEPIIDGQIPGQSDLSRWIGPSAHSVIDMIPPSLVFAFVLSSLYGLVFYLIFGRGWARLAIYWLVGLVGFAAGERLGNAIGLNWLRMGPVYVLEGTLISWASLFVVWLARR
jgi:apolipoprotein N-acyltransferase